MAAGPAARWCSPAAINPSLLAPEALPAAVVKFDQCVDLFLVVFEEVIALYLIRCVAEAGQPFGQAETLPLRWSPPNGLFSLAEYHFDQQGFAALIDYVDRGGYPRWRDKRRPSVVAHMMAEIAAAPWAPR